MTIPEYQEVPNLPHDLWVSLGSKQTQSYEYTTRDTRPGWFQVETPRTKKTMKIFFIIRLKTDELWIQKIPNEVHYNPRKRARTSENGDEYLYLGQKVNMAWPWTWPARSRYWKRVMGDVPCASSHPWSARSKLPYGTLYWSLRANNQYREMRSGEKESLRFWFSLRRKPLTALAMTTTSSSKMVIYISTWYHYPFPSVGTLAQAIKWRAPGK